MANLKKTVSVIEDKKFSKLFLKELLREGKIKFVDVGIFSLKRMPARKGFNPANGKYQTFPSYVKVTFNPDSEFKKTLQLWIKK